MADSPLERLVGAWEFEPYVEGRSIDRRRVAARSWPPWTSTSVLWARSRDDGRTIEGRWEWSPDGTAWELDFSITYRKTS